MGTGPGPHERLKTLRIAIEDLRRYAGTVSRQRFETDRDATRQVKNALYEAADAAVALAQHVVASHGLGPPSDYKAAFDLLAGEGLLAAEEAASMKEWAGFRNVLAHLYTIIDFDKLDERRRDKLGELERFAAWAAERLESPEPLP